MWQFSVFCEVVARRHGREMILCQSSHMGIAFLHYVHSSHLVPLSPAPINSSSFCSVHSHTQCYFWVTYSANFNSKMSPEFGLPFPPQKPPNLQHRDDRSAWVTCLQSFQPILKQQCSKYFLKPTSDHGKTLFKILLTV